MKDADGHLEPLGLQISNSAKPWRIARVFERSPACRAGLSTSWVLVSIEGSTPTKELIWEAMNDRSPKMVFSNEYGQLFVWSAAVYPFGLSLTPQIDKPFRRAIARGEPNRDILLGWYYDDDLSAFSKVHEELISGLVPHTGIKRLLARTPDLDTALATSVNHEFCDFLALSYIAQENYNLAEKCAAAGNEARERIGQERYSANILAINAFALARVALWKGNTEEALNQANIAFQLKPDSRMLSNFLWTLSDHKPRSVNTFERGDQFGIDYSLINFDPLDELACSNASVRLQDTLDEMQPDQLLVVLVLGGYRSNYYGNLDLFRLACLQQLNSERVFAVHIIASSDYALDARHRQAAEGFAKDSDLDLVLLHDPEDKVMALTNSTTSPARFVLSKSGQILSTQEFADESGYWEAVCAVEDQA